MLMVLGVKIESWHTVKFRVTYWFYSTPVEIKIPRSFVRGLASPFSGAFGKPPQPRGPKSLILGRWKRHAQAFGNYPFSECRGDAVRTISPPHTTCVRWMFSISEKSISTNLRMLILM